ncbi:MAG: diphthine--ammonia ligase [Reichenbachiella sp.]|uniref:Dph6-related ATP pyrophosphatase n=1 Tax=Reichenbachiella sp. TaxID=2184521 RepID=UPI0032972E4D
MKIGCSWSGGKDSCFALMKQIEQGDQLKVVMNVMDEKQEYSKSHGLTQEVLRAQAKALQVPIQLASASWSTYEENFVKNLKELRTNHEIEGMVYGDIDIQKHLDWEEKVSAAAGLEAYLPLWQGDRRELVEAMIDAGMKAIIVSCNHTLGLDFLGEEITHDLIPKLEAAGVDVCGENGEFHTLVVDCPLFENPIQIEKGEKVKTDNYCFIETKLAP